MINYPGLIMGLAAFAIIGLSHPLVIKLEYHLGKKAWWMLALPGVILSVASLFVGTNLSILLGCLGFSLFWSTLEIFLQHDRVVKGRAKRNPKRAYHD